jgi:hypothetical protein
VGEGLVWWILLQVLYLGSLSTGDLAEVLVAAVVAAGCAVLAVAARRSSGGVWKLPAEVVRSLVVVPAAVVADAARLLATLARPLRLRHSPGEVERRPLTPEPDAVAAGRVAVGGTLLSATPGSYVIDEDPGRRLVTHVQVDGPPQLADRITAGPPDRSRL